MILGMEIHIGGETVVAKGFTDKWEAHRKALEKLYSDKFEGSTSALENSAVVLATWVARWMNEPAVDEHDLPGSDLELREGNMTLMITRMNGTDRLGEDNE